METRDTRRAASAASLCNIVYCNVGCVATYVGSNASCYLGCYVESQADDFVHLDPLKKSP